MTKTPLTDAAHLSGNRNDLLQTSRKLELDRKELRNEMQRVVNHWKGRDCGAQWYRDLQDALAASAALDKELEGE